MAIISTENKASLLTGKYQVKASINGGIGGML